MSKILVTGGCGFIGSNLVHQLIQDGEAVVAFDNLSRKGASANAQWLAGQHRHGLELVRGDVRDLTAVRAAMRDVKTVYHLAGQVAVTTSVADPRTDFEVNALGTFNVLEAARLSGHNPAFVFASTNKVYGGMEDVAVEEGALRYRYVAHPEGLSETQSLDFHSPYGCSKGTGDQYVRDYSRIYGLPTVVFRQSSIYGPRQFGMEDQAWIAWLMIAAVTGKPITIYGDGKQVRDILWVDDLIAAYKAAVGRIDRVAGRIYNMGGGPKNTISIWTETGPALERLHGSPIPVRYADWRPGDQRVYVSDTRKAARELDWSPKVHVTEGFERLYRWVAENRSLFE